MKGVKGVDRRIHVYPIGRNEEESEMKQEVMVGKGKGYGRKSGKGKRGISY